MKTPSFATTRTPFHDYEIEVQKIHPGFFQKLWAASSTLTKRDVEICTLLRLGLSSSDTAFELHIEEKTLYNHRTRLRKLFGLKRGQTLTMFLRGL